MPNLRRASPAHGFLLGNPHRSLATGHTTPHKENSNV